MLFSPCSNSFSISSIVGRHVNVIIIAGHLYVVLPAHKSEPGSHFYEKSLYMLKQTYFHVRSLYWSVKVSTSNMYGFFSNDFTSSASGADKVSVKLFANAPCLP